MGIHNRDVLLYQADDRVFSLPSVYHHLHGNPNAMATESHGPVLMVVPTLKTQHCIVNINKPITKTAAATLQIGIFKKPIASVQKEIDFYLSCKMFFSI